MQKAFATIFQRLSPGIYSEKISGTSGVMLAFVEAHLGLEYSAKGIRQWQKAGEAHHLVDCCAEFHRNHSGSVFIATRCREEDQQIHTTAA